MDKNKPSGFQTRLLADIGATHARFALETMPGKFESIRILKCQEYVDLVSLVQAYLSEHSGLLMEHAAFAVANPVDGDQVTLTNRDWTFSIEAVRRQFGLETLLVVNGFTALAMSLPELNQDDLLKVAGGTPVPKSVIGVLGPGTGLGVSGLLPTVDGFVTLGSEGGHVDFAPFDDREYAILQFARKTWPHVSAERVLSGSGLEIIYQALAERNQLKSAPLNAQDIVENALIGTDALCTETVECFCAMLGSFSANLAVTLGALGGIFIGGGIVPRIAGLLLKSSFRQRFENKGRFSGYLAKIPTYVITSANPAFYGISAILSEHLRSKSGSHPLTDRIRRIQTELPPAERRVASLVLDNPRMVINEAIAEIARLAQVSQPTVIRFCRSLGFQGLSDFKLKFASSLTGTVSVRHSQVRFNDSIHDLSAKVIDNTVAAILLFRDQLDIASLDQTINALRSANRVEFFALGNSRAIAMDGQHKFFRLRIPTAACSDAHLFNMAADLLKPGDVAFFISNSGKLPELLEAADCARNAGATVIAIAPHQSPLARRANVCLAMNHAEESTPFMSMVSRILQLLIIDIVSVGISVDTQNDAGKPVHGEISAISHLDS